MCELHGSRFALFHSSDILLISAIYRPVSLLLFPVTFLMPRTKAVLQEAGIWIFPAAKLGGTP
jgi:hypothetical protein